MNSLKIAYVEDHLSDETSKVAILLPISSRYGKYLSQCEFFDCYHCVRLSLLDRKYFSQLLYLLGSEIIERCLLHDDDILLC